MNLSPRVLVGVGHHPVKLGEPLQTSSSRQTRWTSPDIVKLGELLQTSSCQTRWTSPDIIIPSNSVNLSRHRHPVKLPPPPSDWMHLSQYGLFSGKQVSFLCGILTHRVHWALLLASSVHQALLLASSAFSLVFWVELPSSLWVIFEFMNFRK